MSIPKQSGKSSAVVKGRPSHGTIVNVGDMVGRLGDGTLCSAGHWPKGASNDATRSSFKAAFVGISGTYCDEKFTKETVRTIDVIPGGSWIFDTRGEIAIDAPLCPAMSDIGVMSSQLLEACDRAEAIFVAKKSVAENSWNVE